MAKIALALWVSATLAAMGYFGCRYFYNKDDEDEGGT
jgi:hypothetical protein